MTKYSEEIMSLTRSVAGSYDASGCAPLPDTLREERISRVLAIYSLTCGFSQITADNWTAVYARCHLHEVANGPTCMVDYERIPVTAADVHARIGMTFSCGRDMDDAAWGAAYLPVLYRELIATIAKQAGK